jgi:NAD(P)-dependent dehydrogenase (short-subunit alcohol dehydrogenase family)
LSRLKGKVAIVTGAGSGIGEAIARRFSAECAKAAVADIDGDGAQAVATRLSDAAAFRVDVADNDAVRGAVAEIVAMLGPPDILVNNAGVNVFGEPLATTEADWRRCLSVDLEGAWNLSRETLPHIDCEGKGRDHERRQPRGRHGRPEEIAANAASLASDETGMIVGANIVADGGVTIRMYE